MVPFIAITHPHFTNTKICFPRCDGHSPTTLHSLLPPPPPTLAHHPDTTRGDPHTHLYYIPRPLFTISWVNTQCLNSLQQLKFKKYLRQWWHILLCGFFNLLFITCEHLQNCFSSRWVHCSTSYWSRTSSWAITALCDSE